MSCSSCVKSYHSLNVERGFHNMSLSFSHPSSSFCLSLFTLSCSSVLLMDPFHFPKLPLLFHFISFVFLFLLAVYHLYLLCFYTFIHHFVFLSPVLNTLFLPSQTDRLIQTQTTSLLVHTGHFDVVLSLLPCSLVMPMDLSVLRRPRERSTDAHES